MPKKLFWRRLRIVLHTTVATILATVILLAAILWNFWRELPDIDAPGALVAPQSVRITDRNGHELYRIIGHQDRTWVHLEDIPLHVQHAFIAVEDKRFYSRPCVDIRALVRAAKANLEQFGSQGGSTITQQLARTVFLEPEKSIDRKIREVLLACQLEAKYSKDEILELYLNWIAFGHGISGVQQAGKFYFGVPATELSVGQAAILAALPQRPTYLSPHGPNRYITLAEGLKNSLRQGNITHGNQIQTRDISPGLLGRRTRVNKQPFILEGRANVVVRKMHEQGYISTAERKEAQNNFVTMRFAPPGHRILAPHFVLWVREQLPAAAARENLLEVRTTLDIRYQQIADAVVAEHYDRIAQEAGAKHVALVALDRRTREILAYKGNVGFLSGDAGKIDMAQSPRQPGSSFKPFVYAAAFRKGYSIYSTIIDAPLIIGGIEPKNYEGGYKWRMIMGKALAQSRNIPAIKTYFRAGGEEPVLRTAAAMGVYTPLVNTMQADRHGQNLHFGWPLALGAAEVPLLEMVHGYSTLANDGRYKPIRSLLTVQSNNEQLFSSRDASYQAIDSAIAQNITDALRYEEWRPEGAWRQAMHLENLEAAIKTGTSNIGVFPRDTWTIGYTPEFVVGVWVGHADGTPLHPNANGLAIALPIWKDFIHHAHKLRPFGKRFF